MILLGQATKHKLHEIIFEADTFGGKLFDLLVILGILLSVLVVMLESVPSINVKHEEMFKIIEWIFTILFTVEYIARIIVLKKPIYYIKSFYGVVDLLSIIPTYLSLFFIGTQALMVFRIIRLLRIFRILKLVRFLNEGSKLFNALKSSLPKIIVFLVSVICIVLIVGTIMYIIEGGENGFDSIPRSIYWAIVTMTTVGYGDIAPQTVVGQTLASFIMILGYGIIAIPTGIVSSQMYTSMNKKISTQVCPSCGKEGHDYDAKFCKYCSDKL